MHYDDVYSNPPIQPTTHYFQEGYGGASLSNEAYPPFYEDLCRRFDGFQVHTDTRFQNLENCFDNMDREWSSFSTNQDRFQERFG